MNITINTYTPTSNINFASNFKFKTLQKELGIHYKKNGHRRNISKVIDDVISNPDNIIGEGNSKIVYAIPGIENFVIAKYKKRIHIPNRDFKSTKPRLSKNDYGEPIATNRSDIIVMEKVQGIEHSLPKWTHKFNSLMFDGIKPTYSDSKIFLSHLENIESFPQAAYTDLAEKIKYLSDKNIRIDIICPNNILVDNKNKKFNIIDVMDHAVNKEYKALENPKNRTPDMIFLLLDSILHNKYLEQLDKKDQQKIISLSKSIIKKCKIAGKTVGLKDDCTNAKRAIELCGEHRNKHHVISQIYNEFIDTYKDVLFSP